VPSFSPAGSDQSVELAGQSPGQAPEVFIMAPLSLFTVAFGLPAFWEVVDVAFDPEPGRIAFHLASASGTRFACPHCGAEHQPVHDTLERD